MYDKMKHVARATEVYNKYEKAPSESSYVSSLALGKLKMNHDVSLL